MEEWMKPSERSAAMEFLKRLTEGLGQALGPNCEIVLHDFSQPEQSIVAIANGHITGRAVGDTLDVLGFQLLRQRPPADLLNYRTNAKNGKVLRSSSIFLRDEAGEIFGSLCVNSDISSLLNLQECLRRELQSDEGVVEEHFEHSVEEVLDRLISTAVDSIGKPVSDLTREEKVSVVAQLESRGAFLIRYSVDRVAERLSLSKYTIYNYLDEVKQHLNGAEPETTKAAQESDGT
jgi:predicted transcriptional regulator YheO